MYGFLCSVDKLQQLFKIRCPATNQPDLVVYGEIPGNKLLFVLISCNINVLSGMGVDRVDKVFSLQLSIVYVKP